MNNQTKIENFFIKEFNSGLKNVFIINNNDGSFELFNKYTIKRENEVLYRVDLLRTVEKYYFSSLKNAVTWCIFHKHNRFSDFKRIEELDFLLNSIQIVISQQKRILSNSKDLTDRIIYTTKIHENNIKKSRMNKELQSYINISRHWQNKKFTEMLPK